QQQRSPLFPYTTLFRSRLDGGESIDAGRHGLGEIGFAHRKVQLLAIGRTNYQWPMLRTYERGQGRLVTHEVLRSHRRGAAALVQDRKSTRLNSSHVSIS